MESGLKTDMPHGAAPVQASDGRPMSLIWFPVGYQRWSRPPSFTSNQSSPARAVADAERRRRRGRAMAAPARPGSGNQWKLALTRPAGRRTRLVAGIEPVWPLIAKW